MATTRRARAEWRGPFSSGNGDISLDSSHIGPFRVAAAVGAEGPPGCTSPMELLAAAYASCVCGTIAYMLEKAGHHPDELETAAEVDMQPGEGVTGIRAVVSGVVPGVSPDDFAAIVTRAKDGCPVGRALTGTKVTLAVELH